MQVVVPPNYWEKEVDQKTVHARDDEDESIHPDTLRHDDDDHDDDGFVTVFEVFLPHSISTPKRTNIGWPCYCRNGCGKSITVTWQTDFVHVAFAPLFVTLQTDHVPLFSTLSSGQIFDLFEAAHQDGRALKEVERSFRDLQTQHDFPSCLCRDLEVAKQDAR